MSKSHSALEEMSTVGEFKRKDSAFRHIVAKETKFPPECELLQNKQKTPSRTTLHLVGGGK